jgi:hypothetical protein
MANKPPRPNPSWRDRDDSPGGASAAQRGWRKEPEQKTGSGRKLPRWARLALVFGAFLVVIGTIVAVILWLRPARPPHLILIGATNAANLEVAHNVAGQQGLRAVKDWAEGRGDAKDKIKVKSLDLLTDSSTWDEWLAECKGSLTEKAAEKVILFLAVHGGSDSQGAFLIPDNADPKQRIRLTEVLERLKQLPEKTAKLLILDVTQVPAHWALGQPHNDFARALKSLDADIQKIPNLVVLSASGEDQRSWVSEEWGRTIFAHYVLEGLKGAADTQNNLRVTAWELAEYVRDRVRKWVQDNRDALQEPVLLPTEPEGEKRAKDLIVVAVPTQGYREQSPDTLAKFEAPTALRKVWKDCEELQKSAASPAVAAPHLWRRYLESLLRYEQLVRLGDEDAANKLALADRHREVARAARRELRMSATNALALAAILGPVLPGEEEEQLRKEFGRLSEQYDKGKAAAKDFTQLYEKQAEGMDELLDAVRRLKLLGLAVELAAQEPERNLKKAAEIVTAMGGTMMLRPAEAHFVVMLQDYVAEAAKNKAAWEPDWKLIKQAIELRQQAEQAALGLNLFDPANAAVPVFSEQVYPWIADTIQQADRKRQAGQDRLFLDASERGKAVELFKEAATLYQTAQKDAFELRQALRVRDEVLAALPYYSHWLARRRPPEVPDLARAVEDIVVRVEKLWADVHELDRLLAAGPGKEGMPAKLCEKARAIDKAFQETVRVPFTRHCDALSKGTGDVQSRWHEIEVALVVPFIEPDLRVRLINSSRAISHGFNIKSSRDAQPVSPERTAVAAAELARRQGQMALAVLGQEWVEQDGAGSFRRLLEDMGQPLKEQRPSLARAWEDLGKLWTRRVEQVHSWTRTGRDGADEELAKAARWARHLEGAALPHLKALNPIDEHRRLLAYHLLCGQAERALSDHWFAEALPPYFQRAGTRFLADALVLLTENRSDQADEVKAKRQDRLSKLGARLAEKGNAFTAQVVDGTEPQPGPVDLHVTDERSILRRYHVRAPATVPEGVPVLWVRRGDFLKPLDPADDGKRLGVEIGGEEKRREATRSFRLSYQERTVKRPEKDTSAHVLQGYFRGQRFQAETNVYLHRMPDLTTRQHEMPLGAVAVQEGGQLGKFRAETTALAIVLDNSGSMSAVKDKVKDKRTRLERALDALKTTLASPQLKEVTISLRVFDPQGVAKTPLVWPAAPWNPDAAENLVRKLRGNLAPRGQTPLVQTMIDAKNDFKNFKGPNRVMLVITDGGDSDHTAADVRKQLLKEFGDRRIVINAIGFEIGPDDQFKEAAQAFEDVIKGKQLDSYYLNAGDEVALLDRLRKTVVSLPFELHQTGSGQAAPVIGEVGRVGQYQWSSALEPTTYNLYLSRLVDPKKDVQSRIALDPGDFLVFDLARPGDKFLFERAIYGRRALPERRKEVGDVKDQWLPAIHQNYQDINNSLQLLLTLEKLTDRVYEEGKGELKQVKPSLLYYQVKLSGPTQERVGLSVAPAANYPAPAWHLELKDWPRGKGKGAAPVVQAWWTEDTRLAFDENHPYARWLLQDRDFTAVTDNREPEPKRIKAAVAPGKPPVDVVIESVSVEENWPIAFRSGGKPQPSSCLVVRLRFPKETPFLVRIPGAGVQEHRLYTEAGKYTAIFAGWTREQLKAGKLGMALISVEGLKDYARASRTFVELEPGEPNDTNTAYRARPPEQLEYRKP